MNQKRRTYSADGMSVAIFGLFLVPFICLLTSGCSSPVQQRAALESENPVVKENAIKQLTKENSWFNEMMGMFSGDENKKQNISLLVRMLSDKNESTEIDAQIIRALGELGKTMDVPVGVLVERLRDSDRRVCEQAVIALGKIKRKEATKPLTALLEQKKYNNSYAIIWALGEIGDSRAIPFLKKLLASGDIYTKYHAKVALGKIGVLQGAREPEYHIQEAESVQKDGRYGVADAVLNTYKVMMRVIFQKISDMKNI